MSDHPDFPLLDVAVKCAEHIRRGHSFHQKFTCEHCGTRQTMEQPDKLFKSGICEECKKETDIAKRGCNFLLVVSNAPIR